MNVRRARRHLAATTAALIAGSALAACGSSDSSGDGSSAPAGSGKGAGSGFPVTINDGFGKVTVKKKPERIVALRGNYVDLLDSVGEKPVAFAASPRGGVTLEKGYPWLKGKDVSAHSKKLMPSGYEIDVEAVASYKPDLILASNWNDKKALDQLKQVAPTYAGTEKPGTITTWEQDLTAVGKLTGKSSQANAAMKKVDGEFAAARKRLPGLQGKSYMSAFYQDGGFRDGAQAEFPFLDDLGLKPATNLPKSVSMENLDDLDSDVLWFVSFVDPAGEKKIKADPRYPNLPAAKNGTAVFADATRANATAEGGPAATSWLLSESVPILEKSALNKAGQ